MIKEPILPLEDELGDVLEKAMRREGLAPDAVARRAGVAFTKIRDAIDYRPDLSCEELRRIAEEYFSARAGPAAVLHLIDSRHPGIASDLEAPRWLQALDVERAIVATKIDKLSRAERVKNLRELERQLGKAALPLSAASGEGLDDLWTLIARLSRQ